MPKFGSSIRTIIKSKCMSKMTIFTFLMTLVSLLTFGFCKLKSKRKSFLYSNIFLEKKKSGHTQGKQLLVKDQQR